MNMQPGNKDNIVNISKFKHKQDPLNNYTMSLIEKGLPQDTTDLSAQNVLWDNSRIDPIMYNQAKNPFGLPPIKNEGGTYEIDPACINRKVSGYKPEIEDSQLIPYKSLIRKIFDWLMVKGI